MGVNCAQQCRHLLYTCHYSVVLLLVSIIAHFKVKDYGMGIYSFSSNNYKGCCLRISNTWVNIGGYARIQQKTQQGKVRLVLDLTLL